MIRYAVRLGVALLLSLLPAVGLAATGDTLYVQKKRVNLRGGPSTQHPVILTLGAGHRMTELDHVGQWVKVAPARGVGQIGWMHRSLVGATSRGGQKTAPASLQQTPAFRQFLTSFQRLNQDSGRTIGTPFFSDVKQLGDGVIQLFASDIWLALPVADRYSNLQTIFNLWDAADGRGLPISVHVVDRHGQERMSQHRR